MKRMTSEIIVELQKCVNKHGDMPFILRDNEYGSGFSNPAVFVDTVENGGCMEGDTPAIGLAFCDEWEGEEENRVPAKKLPVKVIVEDDQIAVRCAGGEWLVGGIDNRWLWVLGAIAFPGEHTIEISDQRKHRQEHQKDMTTAAH